MRFTAQTLYNFLGLSSATLCLLHCLLVPILSIVPLKFFDSVWIDILFCSIGMIAVSKIIMARASKLVKLILICSIFIVIVSVMIEIVFEVHSEGMLLGGIGLLIGHFLNYKNHSHS